MVTIRDEAYPEVVLCLQLARFEDMLADGLDVLRSRGYITALTPCAVLHEDEVPVARMNEIESRLFLFCRGAAAQVRTTFSSPQIRSSSVLQERTVMVETRVRPRRSPCLRPL